MADILISTLKTEVHLQKFFISVQLFGCTSLSAGVRFSFYWRRVGDSLLQCSRHSFFAMCVPFALRRSSLKSTEINCRFFNALVKIPNVKFALKKPEKSGFFACWRRVRDLNPSYPCGVNTISNRAPSTTQPTLHFHSYVCRTETV